MFTVEGRVARADIREQTEIDGIVSRLEDAGYRSLLRNLIRTVSDVAGLPADRHISMAAIAASARRFRPEATAPIGDLFFRDDRAYLLQAADHQLYAWEIRHHSDDQDLTSLCDATEAGARSCIDGRRLRGMQFSWEPIPTPSTMPYVVRAPYRDAPALDVKAPIYTPEQAEHARLLRSREHREILLRLVQMRGRARAVDAPDTAAGAAASALADAGLLRTEYLVLCRGDSRTILTAPDRETLESQPAKAFRCPVCGRAMSDEVIQEISAVTTQAQELLAGSHWMTIWVTTLLEAAGVPREAIGWNAAAGDDEIDIVISLPAMKVFLELKDREFGLGDAYPFASRTSRYSADVGAVLCTEQVAEEAKSFLGDRRGADAPPIETVEGERTIETRLRHLVSQWSVWAVQRILNEPLDSLGASAAPILTSWMRQRERVTPKRRPARPITESEAVVTPGVGPVATPSNGAPH